MSKLLVLIHRFVYFFETHKMSFIGTVINLIFIRVVFGCKIGNKTKLGSGVVLGYGGLGTVIHTDAVIGNNVEIGTGVTIGGNTLRNKGAPIIGNDVLISTGSKILGPIHIGDNCIVAANSVVISSIPSNCMVAGVPAQIKKTNINITDYK